jgi:hypothetical protein
LRPSPMRKILVSKLAKSSYSSLGRPTGYSSLPRPSVCYLAGSISP